MDLEPPSGAASDPIARPDREADEPPPRKPPARKPAARKPAARKPAAGAASTGKAAGDEVAVLKPAAPKPTVRKPSEGEAAAADEQPTAESGTPRKSAPQKSAPQKSAPRSQAGARKPAAPRESASSPKPAAAASKPIDAPPKPALSSRKEVVVAQEAPSGGEADTASRGESGDTFGAASAVTEKSPSRASSTPRSTTSERQLSPKKQQGTTSGKAFDDQPAATAVLPTTAEPETVEPENVGPPTVKPETVEPEPEPEPVDLEAKEPRTDPPAAAMTTHPERAKETAPTEAAVPGETLAAVQSSAPVLVIEGLVKRFDNTVAVAGIDLTVRAGTIFGIVGPNGAGKTTTLSMVTGLLRPDAGRVLVHGVDVWKDPVSAKRNMGVLPDRLRLFDRLTGAQLLYYSGTLRGLNRATVTSRTADLAAAFGLEDALERLVTDYSAGMTKKIALAAAMIHSPRVLILDEPFEAVDPVSAANVIEILQKYATAGGTVVLSSHSMDLIQRICDSVAIVVRGAILASGTMDEVRDGATLEDRFVDLAGGRKAAEGMEWLHSFSN